jgi:hypothetical protein
MTIGTFTCSPQCQFRLMRSYMTQISFSGVLGMPVITDNKFFFTANPAIVFDYTCIFKPAWWQWSAGAFFLEDLIDEFYYEVHGGGVHNGVNFSATYVYHGLNNEPSVNYVPFGVSTPPNYFPLPPADRPYWRNGDDP